jgi:hypothetical protein
MIEKFIKLIFCILVGECFLILIAGLGAVIYGLISMTLTGCAL